MGVVPVALDVTNFEAIEELPKLYGDVDLVVNNAGFASYASATGKDEDIIAKAQQEMVINYLGPMAIVKAFAPILASKDNTAVVNISSIASYVNFPLAATYSASKAASHSLTQAQRRELASSLV